MLKKKRKKMVVTHVEGMPFVVIKLYEDMKAPYLKIESVNDTLKISYRNEYGSHSVWHEITARFDVKRHEIVLVEIKP